MFMSTPGNGNQVAVRDEAALSKEGIVALQILVEEPGCRCWVGGCATQTGWNINGTTGSRLLK